MLLPGFSPKSPALPALPPLPDPAAEETERKRRETEQSAKRRRGRSSTRLSGALGDTSEANVDRPALTRLGG